MHSTTIAPSPRRRHSTHYSGNNSLNLTPQTSLMSITSSTSPKATFASSVSLLDRSALPSDVYAVAHTVRATFPTYSEIVMMPHEMQQTLLCMVYDFLERRFYPILLVYLQKRWRRRELAKLKDKLGDKFPVPSHAAFASSVFFEMWSSAAIEMMIQNAEPVLMEAGEIAGHQGARAEGVLCLAAGGAEVRTKKSSTSKFITPETTELLSSEMRIMAEFSVMTDEPRLYSIVCTSQCIFYRIRVEVFRRALNMLDKQTIAATHALAQRKRIETMHNAYPVTTSKLRRCVLLEHWPENTLLKIVDQMKPRALQRGDVLASAGDVAEHMYYVVHGALGVFKKREVDESTAHAGETTREDGGEGHVKAVSPTAHCAVTTAAGLDPKQYVLAEEHSSDSIIGEMCLVFVQRRSTEIRALCAVDVYVLSKADFSNVMVRHPDVRKLTIDRATALQEEWISSQRGLFSEWVTKIPLAMDLASTEALIDLSQMFRARVYLNNEVMLSRAHLCDRLLIVTSGRAFVSGVQKDLEVGECVGWTCLGLHRWEYLVVARDTVECIELSYDRYRQWLRRNNIYKDVEALTLSLLHPRVYSEGHARAVELTRHLRNVPLYPVNLKPFFVRFATRISTDTVTPVPLAPKTLRQKFLDLNDRREVELRDRDVMPSLRLSPLAGQDKKDGAVRKTVFCLPSSPNDNNNHSSSGGHSPQNSSQNNNMNGSNEDVFIAHQPSSAFRLPPLPGLRLSLSYPGGVSSRAGGSTARKSQSGQDPLDGDDDRALRGGKVDIRLLAGLPPRKNRNGVFQRSKKDKGIQTDEPSFLLGLCERREDRRRRREQRHEEKRLRLVEREKEAHQNE